MKKLISPNILFPLLWLSSGLAAIAGAAAQLVGTEIPAPKPGETFSIWLPLFIAALLIITFCMGFVFAHGANDD